MILSLIEKLLHIKERQCYHLQGYRRPQTTAINKSNVGDKQARCDPLVAGCKADELLGEVWERPDYTDMAVKRGTVRCQSVKQLLITKDGCRRGGAQNEQMGKKQSPQR